MISILDQNRKDLIQNMKKRWKAARAPHLRKFTFKSQLKFLFAFSQPLWAIRGGFYPPTNERQIREQIILFLIMPSDNISLQKLFVAGFLGFFSAGSGADQDKSLCFRWFFVFALYHSWEEMIRINKLLSAKTFDRPARQRKFGGIFWPGSFTCRRPAALQLHFT